MAEYIKREAALALLRPDDPNDERCAVTVATAKRLIRHALTAAPAADVAPVVRCKNCRSYNKPKVGWCEVHLDREHPDDFCSYGEPKEG